MHKKQNPYQLPWHVIIFNLSICPTTSYFKLLGMYRSYPPNIIVIYMKTNTALHNFVPPPFLN